MSVESQKSISDWAKATFGPAKDGEALKKRVMDEIQEFVDAKNPVAEINEAADIVVTLFNLADYYGMDLMQMVDNKMGINRRRQWIAHGDGTGKHIKDGKRSCACTVPSVWCEKAQRGGITGYEAEKRVCQLGR